MQSHLNSNSTSPGVAGRVTTNLHRIGKYVVRDSHLLIMSIPLIVYYLVFCYWPMYGLLIAFKEFNPMKGILGSTWVGLKYFIQVIKNPYLGRIVRNTFLIGVYGLVWGFPAPIIFALCLNEVKGKAFKRVTQTISYMPYFISVVIVVGLMWNLFSPINGVFNTMYTYVTGNPPINFMSEGKWFRTLYIGSGMWQSFGWNSIIYLAAFSNIDIQLYDSARVDGANRLQEMVHITLPGILGTIMIMLILSVGGIMSVGFEKIILMYAPTTYEVADVISTYAYRRGLIDANYSFGTATGLLNSIINVIFLVVANWFCKKYSEVSLW